MIDCDEWKTEKRHELSKYGVSKTTQIVMETVPHVTAWAGRTKYHADGFLLDWVYNVVYSTLYYFI